MVRGPAQPARIRGAGDRFGRGFGALVEVQPPQRHRGAERDDEGSDRCRGNRALSGQRRADDDDRLAQRDQDERLAAFGEVTARDGPVRRAGGAEPGDHEADGAARQVHPDRQQPQHVPDVAAGEPAADRERAAHHAPGQDPLVVLLQRVPAHRHHHEDGPPDLLDRVGAAHPEPQVAERPGQRRRHGQAGQHERDEQQPDGDLLRVQPVGDPRRVGPDQPDHDQQQPGLQRAPHGRVVEQVVRQLGDREHVHQVEEQLDVRDPLLAGTVPQQAVGCHAPTLSRSGRRHRGCARPLYRVP